MKVGVISSTELCLPMLQYLTAEKITVRLYYAAAPGNTAARQAIAFCQQSAVPLLEERTADDVYSWTAEFVPDLIFVIGYGRLLEVNRFDGLPFGIFNIHFGPLPSYRGPSPVFWQLKNGEKFLGLCIHRLVRKADAGGILWQKQIRNEDYFSFTLVNQIFSNLLLEGVNFILRQVQSGQPLFEMQQADTEARYYSRPTLNDVLIDWQHMHAERIVNLCRASNDWNKGAITVYKGAEVKIMDAWVGASGHGKKAGTVLCTKGGLQLACTEQGSLQVGFLSINGVSLGARYAEHFGMLVNKQFGL